MFYAHYALKLGWVCTLLSQPSFYRTMILEGQTHGNIRRIKSGHFILL